MPCFSGTDREEEFDILSLATTQSLSTVLHHGDISDEQWVSIQSSEMNEASSRSS